MHTAQCNLCVRIFPVSFHVIETIWHQHFVLQSPSSGAWPRSRDPPWPCAAGAHLTSHRAAWPANVPIKKKTSNITQIFSLKVSLDHQQVYVINTHKSRLPFPLGTKVFFVFYWHSVKILRKNGKVAEPVRGEPDWAGRRAAARGRCLCPAWPGPALTCNLLLGPDWPRLVRL